MGIPAPLGVSASGAPPAGDVAEAVVTGQFTGIGPGQPFAFYGVANLAIWPIVATTLTTTKGSLSASVASGTGIAAGMSVMSNNVPNGTIWATFSGTSGTFALPPQTYYGTMDEAGLITLASPVAASLVNATVSGTNVPAGATVASAPKANTVKLSAAPAAIAALTIPQPFQFAVTGNAITVTGADASATFTGSALTWSATINLEKSFDGANTWIVAGIGETGTLAQWTGGSPISFIFSEPERQVLYRLDCVAYTSGTIAWRMSQTAPAARTLASGPAY